MAGTFEETRIEETKFNKSKVNMSINVFAHIAFSGCEETLDEQGLKPSILRNIYKNCLLKSRVYHEMTMLGTTFRDSYKTFLRNPNVNLEPFLVKNIVKSRENYAKKSGQTYLYVLKIQLSVQRMYNACVRNFPVYLTFDQFMQAYFPHYLD